MWKNMVQGDRQAAGINVVRRMRVACWIPKTTNTRLCDTCCFSTTTVVMRTRLNVTRTVLVLFECRPGPKSATKKDHFTGTYVSATSVLSKVCLLNSVSVSKPQLHVLIALYSYSWMFSGIYCTVEVVVKWVTSGGEVIAPDSGGSTEHLLSVYRFCISL